jgi:hypothetical protein
MMKLMKIVLVAAVIAPCLFACKVQHNGSFEHDAGFVAASASVGVQIGNPPPVKK